MFHVRLDLAGGGGKAAAEVRKTHQMKNSFQSNVWEGFASIFIKRCMFCNEIQAT